MYDIYDNSSFSSSICISYDCFDIDWLICCLNTHISSVQNMNNNNGVVGGRTSIYGTTLIQIIHELNHIVTSSFKTCCWN